MKKILLFFIGVTSFCFSYSQVTNFTDFNITALTTNENFKDVNTDYFLPITATGIDDEDRYVVTVTRIADELRRLYGNNSNRTAVNNVFGGFRIRRTDVMGYVRNNTYNPNSGWGLLSRAPQLLSIRPNDNFLRPCVLLTNGNQEDYTTEWSGSLYLAAGLAMRGYAVVIYDNIALGGGASNFFWQLAEGYPNPAGTPPASVTQRNIYSMVQLGNAALGYVLNPLNNINIHPNRICAMGGSYGSLSSLMFTYSDFNPTFGTPNFTGSTFTTPNMGDFFARTPINSVPFASNGFWGLGRNIRAMAGLGVGVYINNSFPDIGVLFDNLDANTPMLFLSSNYDQSTPITTGVNPPAPQFGGLLDNTAMAQYNTNNIRFNAYVNIDPNSTHPFFDFVDPSSWSVIPSAYPNSAANNNTLAQILHDPITEPAANRAILKKYMYFSLQAMTATTFIANFFRRSFDPNGAFPAITQNTVKCINPSDVPIRNITPDANGDYFPTIVQNHPKGSFKDAYSFYNCPTVPFSASPLGSVANNFRLANTIQSSTETKAINLPVLYPNPTTGKLNINLQLEKEINGYAVNIFSADGRTIYNKSFAEKIEAAQTLQQNLDISEQPNGVYFVRITSENNVLLSKTFVLNK